MERKLWAVALILALLKTRLDFFHSGNDGDGTLGSQEGNPLNFTSSMKFTTEPHPPVQDSENSLPHDTTRTCFPLITVATYDVYICKRSVKVNGGVLEESIGLREFTIKITVYFIIFVKCVAHILSISKTLKQCMCIDRAFWLYEEPAVTMYEHNSLRFLV